MSSFSLILSCYIIYFSETKCCNKSINKFIIYGHNFDDQMTDYIFAANNCETWQRVNADGFSFVCLKESTCFFTQFTTTTQFYPVENGRYNFERWRTNSSQKGFDGNIRRCLENSKGKNISVEGLYNYSFRPDVSLCHECYHALL